MTSFPIRSEERERRDAPSGPSRPTEVQDSRGPLSPDSPAAREGSVPLARRIGDALGRRVPALTARWWERLAEMDWLRPRQALPTEPPDEMAAVVRWLAGSVARVDPVAAGAEAAIADLVRYHERSGRSLEEVLMHLQALGGLLFDALAREMERLAPGTPAAEVARIGGRLSAGVGILQSVAVGAHRDQEGRRLESFANTLVHELRDPLGAALTGVQTVQALGDDPGTEERRQTLLVRIENGLTRVNVLIDSIRSLTLRGRRPEAETGGVDLLPTLVGRTLAEIQAAGPDGVEVVLESEPPPILVPRDPVQLVLHNLVRNAVKYADPGKPRRRVRIGFEPTDGGAWRIRVEDNGIGIPEEDQERIFDRFYRRGEGPQDGFGLGLAIVREAVAHMGGIVRVESRPGEGSTFSFTIPAEHVHVEEGGRARP